MNVYGYIAPTNSHFIKEKSHREHREKKEIIASDLPLEKKIELPPVFCHFVCFVLGQHLRNSECEKQNKEMFKQNKNSSYKPMYFI